MVRLLPFSEEVNLCILSNEYVKAVMSSVLSLFFWELMIRETIWPFLEPLVLNYY